MTAALTVIAITAALTLPPLALDWYDRRKAAKAQARRRHPANYFKAGNYVQSQRTVPGKFDLSGARVVPPASWSDATEAAIVEAVNVVDDGKALVAEAERFLQNGGRL